MRDRRNTCSAITLTTGSSLIPSFAPDEKSDFLPLHATHDAEYAAPKTHGWRHRVQRSTFVKAVVTICGVLTMLHVGSQLVLSRNILGSTSYTRPVDAISRATVKQPTVLAVHDRHGHSRWTFAIPHNASFPLLPGQYNDICKQAKHMQQSILDQHQTSSLPLVQSHYHDRTFLDVSAAENADILPQPKTQPAENTCKTSLTFVLESSDHSLGRTLLLLWLSYGLARKQGRAFFVDDSRWAYGRYTTFFRSIPSNDCRPPSTHYIVPCTRDAQHLLVSASTASWIFDEKFTTRWTPRMARDIERHRRLFDLLRRGYQDLFHLAADDERTVVERVEHLRANVVKNKGVVIGMHIRRGNLHPFETQYHDDYLPLERYTHAVQDLFVSSRASRHDDSRSQSLLNLAHHKQDSLEREEGAEEAKDGQRKPNSSVILSSDDPALYDSADLLYSLDSIPFEPSQNKIRLATKHALDRVSPQKLIKRDGSPYVKHVEENSGWDGGFFPALFEAIGKKSSTVVSSPSSLPSSSSSPSAIKTTTKSTSETAVDASALRVREMLARAYLLDVAILSRASDGLVCAVSSATCRLLGVMMGWEKIKEGMWMNIDDGRTWSWDGHR